MVHCSSTIGTWLHAKMKLPSAALLPSLPNSVNKKQNCPTSMSTCPNSSKRLGTLKKGILPRFFNFEIFTTVYRMVLKLVLKFLVLNEESWTAIIQVLFSALTYYGTYLSVSWVCFPSGQNCIHFITLHYMLFTTFSHDSIDGLFECIKCTLFRQTYNQ